MAYGRTNYRRRLGRGGGTCGYGKCSPYGQTFTPVPFNRKRKQPVPASGGGTSATLRTGRRVRPRLMVQTRRKPKVNKPVKTGENSSYSTCIVKNPWSPQLRTLYKLVQGRQTRFDQSGTSVSSGTGRQGVFTTRHLSISELNTIAQSCNDGVATSNAIKCFIGGYTMKWSFKNQSNSVGRLYIYDVVCTRNTPATSVDDPKEAWVKGATDLGDATIPYNIGASPKVSPEFRTYWRIRKVTALPLEPGQQHDHVFRRSINKVYDSTLWANQVGYSVGGLTDATLIVWHGSLIHESATPTTVTYSSMTLDLAYTMTYNFGYMKQNVPSHTVTNKFTDTIVDGDFMGESADIDTTPAAA